MLPPLRHMRSVRACGCRFLSFMTLKCSRIVRKSRTAKTENSGLKTLSVVFYRNRKVEPTNYRQTVVAVPDGLLRRSVRQESHEKIESSISLIFHSSSFLHVMSVVLIAKRKMRAQLALLLRCWTVFCSECFWLLKQLVAMGSKLKCRLELTASEMHGKIKCVGPTYISCLLWNRQNWETSRLRNDCKPAVLSGHQYVCLLY